MSFIVGGLIIGGGALIGEALSASASESAANTQAGAAENAQQISENEFNTITGQEQPFMQGGYGALGQLDYLLGVGGQGSTQQIPSGAVGAGTTARPGYDPSSGYQLGANGSLSQLIPGGSAAPAAARQSALPGSIASQIAGVPGAPGSVPGSNTATPIGGGANATAPFSTATGSTAGGYGSLLTPFNASMMQQYSPAYQFQLQQGQQGVLNQDSGAQGAESGASLKDLLSFNQNYANTAFNNAFSQYQTQQGNVYNRLLGVAQLGQNAAANTGFQGTTLAGQAAQSATNIGTAQAAGTIGAANSITGGLNTALPFLMQGQGSSGVSASAADTDGLGDF